jgi:hypothetical protein
MAQGIAHGVKAGDCASQMVNGMGQRAKSLSKTGMQARGNTFFRNGLLYTLYPTPHALCAVPIGDHDENQKKDSQYR